MISRSKNDQRLQIKLQLGKPDTATVADLDDWLQGGRSGNYLYFKQDKNGTTTASSKHYDAGFNKKPPKTSRLAFHAMALGMAQKHVNDADAKVDAAAQALLNFCVQHGAQKGLQNHRPLRTAVHALRLALDARAAQQADLPVDDGSSHSDAGTLHSPHKPTQSSEASLEFNPAPEPDRRAALKQRAIEQRRAVKAKLAPTGDAAKEAFARETAKEFRDAIQRGRCHPQGLVAYYLKSRARFSLGGKTPTGALAELSDSLGDTQLLGLLPQRSVDSFINDVLSLQLSPWEVDSDMHKLRETSKRSADKWRSRLKDIDEGPHWAKKLEGGSAKSLAQRVWDGEAKGHASLLRFFLDALSPFPDASPVLALTTVEALMEGGLLGMLPAERTQQLIDEFVIAKAAVRNNLPIPF